MITRNRFQEGWGPAWYGGENRLGFWIVSKFTELSLSDVVIRSDGNLYVAKAEDGTLNVSSASALDTAANGRFVNVYYADSDGIPKKKRCPLNGTTAVEVATDVAHIFSMDLEKKCVGAVTAIAAVNAGKLVIPAGRMDAQVCHMLARIDNADDPNAPLIITHVKISLTTQDGDLSAELREYPLVHGEITGIRDLTDGYAVRWNCASQIAKSIRGDRSFPLNTPIVIQPGSYVALVGTGADAADGYVELAGFIQG